MSTKQIELYVANLDCEHDAAAIERGLAGSTGVVGMKVYPKAAKVSLTFEPTATSEDALKEKLEGLGFPPQETRALTGQPKLWRNPKVVTSAISRLS